MSNWLLTDSEMSLPVQKVVMEVYNAKGMSTKRISDRDALNAAIASGYLIDNSVKHDCRVEVVPYKDEVIKLIKRYKEVSENWPDPFNLGQPKKPNVIGLHLLREGSSLRVLLWTTSFKHGWHYTDLGKSFTLIPKLEWARKVKYISSLSVDGYESFNFYEDADNV